MYSKIYHWIVIVLYQLQLICNIIFLKNLLKDIFQEINIYSLLQLFLKNFNFNQNLERMIIMIQTSIVPGFKITGNNLTK